MWGIGETAESFGSVHPHKHQISLFSVGWFLRPQMVWGRSASGALRQCANGVLTFDPCAMPAEPRWDCRRSLAVLRPGEVRMI